MKTAEEMRKLTPSYLDRVLIGIEREAKSGGIYYYVNERQLSKEEIEKLQELGYKVETFYNEGSTGCLWWRKPYKYFRYNVVSW